MGRPAKPPRLKLRDGVWHIHDTANGYRRSTGTADEALAERLLKEYVMTLAGFVPPEDPKISDLMEAYRRKKLDDYRERAREGAKVLARRQGLDARMAEQAAVTAAEQVTDTGSSHILAETQRSCRRPNNSLWKPRRTSCSVSSSGRR